MSSQSIIQMYYCLPRFVFQLMEKIENTTKTKKKTVHVSHDTLASLAAISLSHCAKSKHQDLNFNDRMTTTINPGQKLEKI